MEGNNFVFDSILESIDRGNKVFISSSEILDAGTGLFSVNADFLKPLFDIWQKPEDAIKAIKEIIGSFRDRLVKNKMSWNLSIYLPFRRSSTRPTGF